MSKGILKDPHQPPTRSTFYFILTNLHRIVAWKIIILFRTIFGSTKVAFNRKGKSSKIGINENRQPIDNSGCCQRVISCRKNAAICPSPAGDHSIDIGNGLIHARQNRLRHWHRAMGELKSPSNFNTKSLEESEENCQDIQILMQDYAENVDNILLTKNKPMLQPLCSTSINSAIPFSAI